MRKQYHFRPSRNGFFAWDVDRLIDLSKGLEVVEFPLDQIREIKENYWFGTGEEPTVQSIAEHLRIMAAADLKYPILMCAEQRVMDGMHRVLKSLIAEEQVITTKIFPETPLPDYEDVYPDDLPY